jgi:hypothetical protein
VFLNTLHRRFPDVPQPSVSDQDVVDVGQCVCKGSAFNPESKPLSEKDLGVDADKIVNSRSEWRSYTPQTLATNQFALLRALMLSPRSSWGQLSLASLIRPHMIVSNGDALFYVVFVCKYMFYAWALEWNVQDVAYALGSSTSAICELTVDSLDMYKCHDYSIGLNGRLAFACDEGVSLVRYVLLNTVHTFSLTMLRKVLIAPILSPSSSE